MARWQGTTAQRGYAGPHQKLRARWKPHVDAGQVNCHAVICLEERDGKTRRILPDMPGQPTGWHLGHTSDRTAWTGPEHARCNLADANRRRSRAPRRLSPRPHMRWITSRTW